MHKTQTFPLRSEYFNNMESVSHVFADDTMEKKLKKKKRLSEWPLESVLEAVG